MKSEDRGVKLKPAMERVVTAAELSEHTSQDDCWFVVDGKVYDVTNWLAQHPGGGAVILGASADPSSSSAMFHAMHGNAERALENVEKSLVGVFEPGDDTPEVPQAPVAMLGGPPAAAPAGPPPTAGTASAVKAAPAAGGAGTVQIILPDSLAQMTTEQLAALGAGMTGALAAPAATAPIAAAEAPKSTPPVNLQQIINIDQMQAHSDALVPDPVRVWWEHGGEDEETFRANRAAWGKFAIRPAILNDVASVSLGTRIL